MSKLLNNTVTSALAAGAAVLLASCSAPGSSGTRGGQAVTMPVGCGNSGAVVLAVESHANVPPAVVTASMQAAIQNAANSGGAIGVVSIDGAPQLVRTGVFKATAGNDAANESNEAAFVNGVTGVVDSVRATSAHVDALGALRVSAGAVTAACPSGGTVFFEDSGLPDTGAMNFAKADLLQASPAEVSDFLKHNRALPNLKGIHVVLVGIGDTMPPQLPLDQASRDNLIAIWKSVVTAAGADSVTVDPTPVQSAPNGKARADLPEVLTVSVPSPPDFQGVIQKLQRSTTPTTTTVTLPDAGPIGFLPDQAVFRDPHAAEKELDDLATALRQLAHAKIAVLGTTSSAGDDTPAGEQGRRTLSRERANVVRMGLIDRHVPASWFEPVQGNGYHFDGYVPDRAQDGSLLPGPAAQNRSVRITITSSGAR